jgi:hypothetical protein
VQAKGAFTWSALRFDQVKPKRKGLLTPARFCLHLAGAPS